MLANKCGAKQFSYDYSVSKEDTVPEYNHVHHAKIVSLFELGRLKLLEAINCPQDKLVAEGYFLVISELEVKFLREIVVGDYVITCEDLTVSGKKIEMDQRIISKSKNKVMASAEITLMMVRRDVGRSIAVPAALKEALLADR